MFPQPALPKRMYIYAGLSLLALGYCMGRCGKTEPAIQTSSSLEQTITKTVQEQQPAPPSQPAPEPPRPVEQPLTIEQRLLRYLKHPVHNPSDPGQADIIFQHPNTISGTNDSSWNKLKIFAREKFYDISNEARFTYGETKNYLKDKCMEAIK